MFEDLHWIDSETQALFDSLVESLPTARLLLLVNYRPEYEHGWGGRTYYSQIRLDAVYLRANAGTDRIEANGRLALRPVIEGYPYPVGQQPQLEFVIAVRFIDDRGNVVEQSRRVPLT